MKQLPGFNYDTKHRRVILDGYVVGTQGKGPAAEDGEERQRDQALAAWKTFRADLESGRAIDGPLTLREFDARYCQLISASHTPGTKKTQRIIIKNHLLRYFGDTELSQSRRSA